MYHFNTWEAKVTKTFQGCTVRTTVGHSALTVTGKQVHDHLELHHQEEGKIQRWLDWLSFPRTFALSPLTLTPSGKQMLESHRAISQVEQTQALNPKS